MAGRVAAGAAGWRLSATAPAARVDTKEQWRPAPTRHSVHPRPRGRYGGAAGAGADLRGGPAAQSVRLPSGDGRQDGSSPSLLARDRPWPDRGRRGGSQRLFVGDPARAADGLREPTCRGWDAAVRDQALAHGTGDRARQRPNPMHNGGEGSTSRDPARLPDLAPDGESVLPPLPA